MWWDTIYLICGVSVDLMQPVVSCSQQCSCTLLLLNFLITSSCSQFGGAVVGGWLRLVKPPYALLFPFSTDVGVWCIRRAVWIYYFFLWFSCVSQNGMNSSSCRWLKSHQRCCLPHPEFDSMVEAHTLDLKAVPASWTNWGEARRRKTSSHI